MQHIGLQREDEDGTPIALFDGGKSIDLRIMVQDNATTACLRFIDPYGDAIFNQLQLPVLIDELVGLKEKSTDTVFHQALARTIMFLRESEKIHTYVRFVGD